MIKGMGNHPLFFMQSIIKNIFFSCFSFLYLVSCSSSEETQIKNQEKEIDTVYVFDEIPAEDNFIFESPVQQPVDVFVIQIGAFASFDGAKEFADHSWNKLSKEIKVEFNESKKLYVVWIYPPFQDKKSALEYRSEIQKGGEFSDAWITTIESKK